MFTLQDSAEHSHYATLIALDLESFTCVVSFLLSCCSRLFPEMLKAWDGCQKYFYRSWARRTGLQSALQHASKVIPDAQLCPNIRTNDLMKSIT